MNGYLAGLNAETFELEGYISRFDSRLLGVSEGRRTITRFDPLAFGLMYLGRHLRSEATGGQITFCDLHLELCRQALEWVRPLDRPAQYRDAYVAPRDAGKSIWLHLILPLWAAAHGHIRFIAAFSNSRDQAEMHLANLRSELDGNDYLRTDFPELCQAKLRPDGHRVATRQDMMHQANGFTFVARGIDAGVLGMREENLRPELIVLDDVEPGESDYSAYQADKRLTTLTDDILPLNAFGRVVLVGTVTMPGSIVHQLVKSVHSPEESATWVVEENFNVHYFPPIVTRDDGTERSCWPAKWSIEYLRSIRHTRQFKKNFENRPVSTDGAYWKPDTFVYDDLHTPRTVLFIDPAVTTRKSSDYTGLAVIGFNPTHKKCVVREAIAVKLSGEALRGRVLGLLEEYPEIVGIYIEGNQGQDLWLSVLHDMPVKIVIRSSTESKEVRAAQALARYERRAVLHAKTLSAAEEQMTAFPKVTNDDLVDAISIGVNYWLPRPTPRKTARARAEALA